MRRGLIVLLSLGVVAGYGSAFGHMHHRMHDRWAAHRGECGSWSRYDEPVSVNTPAQAPAPVAAAPAPAPVQQLPVMPQIIIVQPQAMPAAPAPTVVFQQPQAAPVAPAPTIIVQPPPPAAAPGNTAKAVSAE
jgi:hypothetical protein